LEQAEAFKLLYEENEPYNEDVPHGLDYWLKEARRSLGLEKEEEEK